MVWVCIALAIPAVFLLLLYLLRFHFSFEAETPSVLRGTVGVTFLGFRREVIVDAAHAVLGDHSDEDERDDDHDDHDDLDPDGRAGERGALRIPEAWLRFVKRMQTRIRKSLPGFKRVGANSTRSLTISVPDGVCVVKVRFNLSDGQDVDQGNYDACNGGGATVGW